MLDCPGDKYQGRQQGYETREATLALTAPQGWSTAGFQGRTKTVKSISSSLQRRWQLGIVGSFVAMLAFGSAALMAQTAHASGAGVFGQSDQLPISIDDGDFLDPSESCDRGPFGAADEVWHFILTSNDGDFISLSATFEGGVVVDAVLVATGSGQVKHAYVEAPGGLDLIAVSAVTEPAGETFVLSHICGGDGVTEPSGQLTVVKDADLSYERTCTWDVDKTSTTESLQLTPGQAYSIDYTVTVTGNCVDDTAGTVSGTITVTNVGTLAVNGIVITDSMIGAVIDCPETFDGTLAPDASVVCDYTVEGVALAAGENTATASGVDTEGNETEDDDTAEWVVPPAPSVINGNCVTVDDTNAAGPQDVQICSNGSAGPQAPAPINYTVNGTAPALGCVDFSINNTATLSNGESATVEIPVTMPCVHGRTQGFWSNKNGQALIPAGNITTLGNGDCSLLVTKSNSLTVLPGKNGHNGLSLMPDCDLAAGTSAGAFNNLLSQTLALHLNITFSAGYTGQTVAGLGCTAGFAGLTGASTVGQVLAAANFDIAAGGPNAGAFNTLLGCLNREA
jgi:hypothetical protein